MSGRKYALPDSGYAVPGVTDAVPGPSDHMRTGSDHLPGRHGAAHDVHRIPDAMWDGSRGHNHVPDHTHDLSASERCHNDRVPTPGYVMSGSDYRVPERAADGVPGSPDVLPDRRYGLP